MSSRISDGASDADYATPLLTAARSIGSPEEEDSGDLRLSANFFLGIAWALGISSIVYGVILIWAYV